MPDPPPTRIELDGQLFDVVTHPDAPGRVAFTWVSGPNAGYGFVSQTSDAEPMSAHHQEAAIRSFLAQVDPDTGYVD
ncbi:MAG TPA: hypothetical protein VLI04_07640 [Nocardioidaceae bacterium]|nr:hypothetical protein [Nocardioidaceae bacterium]